MSVINGGVGEDESSEDMGVTSVNKSKMPGGEHVAELVCHQGQPCASIGQGRYK